MILKKTVSLNPGESKTVGFQFTPSEARTYNVLVNGLTGSFLAIETPMLNWVLPTGHYDPDNDWEDGSAAYDGDTDTYAENWTGTLKWSGFIELTIAPTSISAVRFYLTSPLWPKVGDIDVYSNGAWYDVWQGDPVSGSGGFAKGWNEREIPGGIKVVTKARFRMYNRSYSREMRFRLHEFEFGRS